MPAGDCELERSAPPGFRFHPDPPTLALDNLFAERQADARAGKFSSMQACKHAERPVGVFGIDAHSVVPH
jgi:hypothetical protein